MTRILAAIMVVAASLILAAAGGHSRIQPSPGFGSVQQETPDYCSWLSGSLKEVETVKIGQTRASLLKVFTTEGGLSTGLRRTYVYRQCRLIKVDVEFETVGRPPKDSDGRVTLVESDQDVIVKLSRPYVALQTTD